MRTFYTLWATQAISIMGTGLTAFAIGVWLFEQTQAVTPLAFLLLFKSLPAVLLSPLAGALVDRWKRRTALVLGDAGAALSTLLLALLFAWTDVPLWGLYVLVALGSACEAFQRPAWQASITALVPEEQYGRAGGMSQVALGASEILAPLVAGLLMAPIGIKGILLIDVGTFCIAATTALLVRFPRRTAGPQTPGKRMLLSEILEGARHLRRQPGLLMLLVFSMTVGFQSGIIGALIQPLVLSFTSPKVLGSIFSIAGIAYLAASLLLSVWGGPRRRVSGLLGATLAFGLFIVLIGMQPLAWLIAVAVTGAHFCVPLMSGINQAIWQKAVQENMQGRVFALREMGKRAALMLAYIAAGPLADNLFGPMLMPGGALEGSLGTVMGVGLGRGMGLTFSLSGLLVVITALIGVANRRLRLLDSPSAEQVTPVHAHVGS
jgi:MFS family permease